jgi:hypothetical protein
MGGHARVPGPLEDLAINPLTGRRYDDIPFCEGPARVLKAGEQIELNQGDYVNARRVARWAGSYRCALHTPDEVGAALEVDVRMVDKPPFTCQGRDGGVVFAPATVSLQLTAADGTILHDGPCSSSATVWVWPAQTNLEVTCSALDIEFRAGQVLIGPTGLQMPEAMFYFAECHAARGD